MASLFWENLSISSIPSFLVAGSAKALRLAMYRNNKKYKGYVHYFNIQYIPEEKRWYAWFIVKDGSDVLLGGTDE